MVCVTACRSMSGRWRILKQQRNKVTVKSSVKTTHPDQKNMSSRRVQQSTHPILELYELALSLAFNSHEKKKKKLFDSTVFSLCGSESSCLTDHKDDYCKHKGPAGHLCCACSQKRTRTAWRLLAESLRGDTERDWTYFNHSVNSLQPCGRQEHLN